VKIGASRQIIVPKKCFDELRLSPGDYLEVVTKGGSLVMTPKTLVDKTIDDAHPETLESARRD